MDTFEARTYIRDIAEEALDIVKRIAAGALPALEDRQRLRQLLLAVREALPDAGYPGESAWRALQRASMGVETMDGQPDTAFWEDVVEELESGIDTLSSLISPAWRRESDFHIVG